MSGDEMSVHHLLDIGHSSAIKPASLLAVSFGKPLKGMLPSLRQTNGRAKQSTRRGGPSLTEDLQTERERQRNVAYILYAVHLQHKAHNKCSNEEAALTRLNGSQERVLSADRLVQKSFLNKVAQATMGRFSFLWKIKTSRLTLLPVEKDQYPIPFLETFRK